MKKVLAVLAVLLCLAGTVNASEVKAALDASSENLTYYGFFETVADMEDSKELGGFKLPGTTRKLSVIISGVIVCRFDMSKAAVSADETAKVISVTLPHAQLFRIIADTDNVRVYDQKEGLFASNLTLNDQNRLVGKTGDIIRNRALNDWKMTAKAEDNARKIITALAQGLGYRASVNFFDSEQEEGRP